MKTQEIIKALRSIPSRSKRALLDEAADRIEELEADLKAALYDLKSCETCYTCKHKKTKELCSCCWHANKWEWQGREK